MASNAKVTTPMLVARGLYRRWLVKYFSTVTLAGLAPDDEPILLRRIYVPLILTPQKVSDYAPESEVHAGGRLLADWLEPSGEPQVFFISGEAGSGKTTLVSALVDSLAGEIGDRFNMKFEGYVPFPILLREAPLRRLTSLEALVEWWLGMLKDEIPEFEPDALRSFLEVGKGIILLDGLDEVGSSEDRARVLKWLRGHRWVTDEHRGRFPGESSPRNPVLVTARPSGFEDLRQDPLLPARPLFVAPFSHEQIETYLTHWFKLRPLQKEQRQSTVETLVRRLTSSDQSERLLPLARRPAYLASLAFVHGTRGELPYTRAALYELLVDAYIEMLDRQKGLLDREEKEGALPSWDRLEKIEVLSAVAFQAHVGAAAREKEKKPWERGEEGRRILWSPDELERAVEQAVKGGARRFRTIRPEHVPALTSYFVSRTGLLVETREGRFQFGHLSFQEYLTALFLLNLAAAGNNKPESLEKSLFHRLDEPGWMEVAVLALAIDATRTSGQGHGPVLARLDLRRPEHLSFLGQILSGAEIRFSEEERRAWLFVWLGFWAFRKGGEYLSAPMRFSANRRILTEAWMEVCSVVAEGRSLRGALGGLVGRAARSLQQEAPPEELSLTLMAQSGRVEAELEAPGPLTVWGLFEPSLDEGLAAARLLVVPLLGEFRPEGWEETLTASIQRAELFQVSPSERILVPTPLGDALDAWSFEGEGVLSHLARRSPLLWWLQDELLQFRASELSGAAYDWRMELARRVLRSEQIWRMSLLSGARPEGFALDLARDRARDRDRARALALALDRDLDLDLARARALDLALDLARARDLALALDRARDLALALDRARALDLARARARALALALDRALARARDLVRDLDRAMESLSRNPSFQERVLGLFSAASSALVLAAVLREQGSVSRSAVEEELAALQDPNGVAAPWKNAPFHDQILHEWRQVLDSPLSPVPLLEDALCYEWNELPIEQDAVVELFKKNVDQLEAEARAADQ